MGQGGREEDGLVELGEPLALLRVAGQDRILRKKWIRPMLQTRSSGPCTEMSAAYSRQVVLVESNPADAALITRVFQETRAWNRLAHFDNCRLALLHLRSRSEEKPLLILLALHMPEGSALPFLETLKADETLKMIPVVVLAESSEKDEVAASFTLGVAGYMIKSADPVKLCEDVTAIRTYWALSQFPRW